MADETVSLIENRPPPSKGYKVKPGINVKPSVVIVLKRKKRFLLSAEYLLSIDHARLLHGSYFQKVFIFDTKSDALSLSTQIENSIMGNKHNYATDIFYWNKLSLVFSEEQNDSEIKFILLSALKNVFKVELPGILSLSWSKERQRIGGPEDYGYPQDLVRGTFMFAGFGMSRYLIDLYNISTDWEPKEILSVLEIHYEPREIKVDKVITNSNGREEKQGVLLFKSNRNYFLSLDWFPSEYHARLVHGHCLKDIPVFPIPQHCPPDKLSRLFVRSIEKFTTTYATKILVNHCIHLVFSNPVGYDIIDIFTKALHEVFKIDFKDSKTSRKWEEENIGEIWAIDFDRYKKGNIYNIFQSLWEPKEILAVVDYDK